MSCDDTHMAEIPTEDSEVGGGCYSENTIHLVGSLFKIGSPAALGLTKWAKSAGQ